MTDLELAGPLDLLGVLELFGEGGIVTVNGSAVLVVGAKASGGVPVLIPPQKPIDDGTDAECVCSLGHDVKASGKTIVTTGMVMHGGASGTKTWPGMLIPSTVNRAPTQVTANRLPVNVVGDKATIFPNGSAITFGQRDKSGQ